MLAAHRPSVCIYCLFGSFGININNSPFIEITVNNCTVETSTWFEVSKINDNYISTKMTTNNALKLFSVFGQIIY